jgi:hypothetical protein
MTGLFFVGVSPAEPTAATDAPPASDNVPATPNTVTALARLLRFEACFASDMANLPFKLGWPELQCNEWPRPGLGGLEGGRGHWQRQTRRGAPPLQPMNREQRS